MSHLFFRQIQPLLEERLLQFPVVVLTGPRQSGKTTLLKQSLRDYDYINLESPDQLAWMQTDPKGALLSKKKGLIIDEAQKVPELFSYVQVMSDERNQKGQFILSGSQNFLLNQHITQSLAGRAAILELLPLTWQEYLTHPNEQLLTIWDWLYQGGYPRPYQDNIPTKVWMDSYVRTYLERDVRDLLHVKDLVLFQRFLRLCAGRHGQLLNVSQLAIDCGISHTTANHWLGILEASYIAFRVPPFHQNFNKRLIKSNKLYFYDSGLVCYLLGIESADQLGIHVSRGAIFEGYILSSMKKYFFNRGESQALYFWQDSYGNEVDCLIEKGGAFFAFEIKSTMTLRPELMKGLKKWQAISGAAPDQCRLIYAGEESKFLSGVPIFGWKDFMQGMS